MNSQELATLIQDKLKIAGFRETGMNKAFYEAIAEAVVEHIQSKASVSITAGSSSGVYKIT